MMSKFKIIRGTDEFYIDIDVLIPLVEKRPVLWNKVLTLYKNRAATQEAWKEVAMLLNPEFAKMTEKKKQYFVQLILQKWSNVRDAYQRYLKKAESDKKSGDNSKTSKPYLYSRQLSFLTNAKYRHKNKTKAITTIQQNATESVVGNKKEETITVEVDITEANEMEGIDIELLITLVHKRPILWDRTMDLYKNRAATQKAWTEIGGLLNPGFSTMGEKQRQCYVKLILRKWGAIRDSYQRCLKKVEIAKKLGDNWRLYKPYIYSKKLTFLNKVIYPYTYRIRDSITSNDDTDNIDSNEDEESNTGDREIESDSNEEDEADSLERDIVEYESNEEEETKPVNGVMVEFESIKEKEVGPIYEHMIKCERNKEEEIDTIDENVKECRNNFKENVKRKKLIDPEHSQMTDSVAHQTASTSRHVSFFDGILPMLDTLDDDESLEFQMGVLQVLKNIRCNRQSRQIVFVRDDFDGTSLNPSNI